MKVLIMAGGTGGHVYPALAVAQALRSRGHEVVWMGAPDSFEARVIPPHGIPMEFVQVSGLRGKGVLKLLWAPLLLVRALLQACTILRRQRPQAVLGMGGFASGPGGVAAWLTRRPLLIHEQNAVAGLTNRILSHFAQYTLQAFPDSFHRKNAKTVGNPVREALTVLPAPDVRLAGRSGRLRLLVIGGSQGARALNEAVPAALQQMAAAQRPEVRHQAGRTLEVARAAYARCGVDARVEPFIDDMAAAYAWADLVVCRAGASTIAELTAVGCAAVLVPFPAAVDDHQTRNGEYLSEAGAALLIPERELSAQRLSALLTELLADRPRLLAMALAARARAQPAAVADIVRRIEQAGVDA
jgi:UDP-N-acetylglucosamine--N-acetylmuramyl-(pentapeptide) pyrophosphoryl-undecaprenol N-acetylglucosamine transferase